ncbi:hypothetical protein [Leucobacter luti]|uniref:Uncharacterized protein n=1 Tax=Leucobacter luti TaxID=340320 RepID=A0A4R6RZG9_9MICO|nr:hypothetical protein [Leucobacter luti]QYM76309.1 hypothetical protein K1X41_02240 [Leucobacter luti]TDP92599.1 hypothetical protein EDF62_1815 [Leucobacter luti]
MPRDFREPILFWQVHQPNVAQRGVRGRGPSSGAPAEEHWHSHVFAGSTSAVRKRRVTRYEKFTTRMVLLSAALTLGVTAGLHALNYGLETKTSSTSGTHSTFYKDDE